MNSTNDTLTHPSSSAYSPTIPHPHIDEGERQDRQSATNEQSVHDESNVQPIRRSQRIAERHEREAANLLYFMTDDSGGISAFDFRRGVWIEELQWPEIERSRAARPEIATDSHDSDEMPELESHEQLEFESEPEPEHESESESESEPDVLAPVEVSEPEIEDEEMGTISSSHQSASIPANFEVVEETQPIGDRGPVYRITSTSEIGDVTFSNTQYIPKKTLSQQLTLVTEALNNYENMGENQDQVQACSVSDNVTDWEKELGIEMSKRRIYEKLYIAANAKGDKLESRLKTAESNLRRKELVLKRKRRELALYIEDNADLKSEIDELNVNNEDYRRKLSRMEKETQSNEIKYETLSEKYKQLLEKYEEKKDQELSSDEKEQKMSSLLKSNEDKDDIIENFFSCTVCKRSKISNALVPCGHLVACDGCLEGYKRVRGRTMCPLCRQGVRDTMRVYLA